jgi:hypothetical protein
MYKILLIVCALFILTYPALAQNEIDHINTLWPSGYGKLALDGDTLYVNILNGHGVERYDVSNPANPIFLDREEVSGFDQIDFQRRLMAKIDSIQVRLVDFSDFHNSRVVSSLPLILPAMRYTNWKFQGNYMIAVSLDDTIRVFNISEPIDPQLIYSYGILQHGNGAYVYSPVIGSKVCIIQSSELIGYFNYIDRYNISIPDSFYLVHSDTVVRSPAGGYGIGPARGDTVAFSRVTSAGYSWSIWLVSYAPGDSTHFPSWGEGANGHPKGFYANDNGFGLYQSYNGFEAYSFDNFTLMGKSLSLPNSFDCISDSYFIASNPNSLTFFQPTYSDSIVMPEIASVSPAHFGILSSATYGNYILSGAESNGGELLIHELNQAGQLNLISYLDSVRAKDIIVSGTFAICFSPNKIVQVHLNNPSSPHIEYEISGFSGALVDFVKQDSLIYAISNQNFYLIDYDSLSGFNLVSSLSIPGFPLTGICQYNTGSFILKGNIGIVIRVETSDPTNPVINDERRLPQNLYQNIEQFHASLWASGPAGTDVISANRYMQDIITYGPEYFSDVHQLNVSNDTLYVADGNNGIKVFTFNTHPYYGLRFIGGYGTGNVINQVSTIGNNFFASDYYSLQQLRWGAPTGIEIHDTPAQPERFTLSQNYPNPFNAKTTIRYELPPGEKSTLTIFDITGRQIQRLNISGDKHEIIWDGASQSGQPVSSGIYFYTLDGHPQSARKMVLLK